MGIKGLLSIGRESLKCDTVLARLLYNSNMFKLKGIKVDRQHSLEEAGLLLAGQFAV